MLFSCGLVVLLFSLVGPTVWASSPDDVCNLLTDCNSCTSSPTNCVWCSKGSGSQEFHCQLSNTTSSSHSCLQSKANIEPKEQIILLQNDPLDTSTNSMVQIQPQRMKIKARPGDSINFTFGYMQAFDHPLDLYYLMDLSSSMNKDKENLSDLGHQLANKMKQKSSNLRIGFGSFIDKPMAPLGGSVEYSFKNHLPLTEDVDLFVTSVTNAKTFGGGDGPEGGFDALMQTMVCSKEIGWRPDALHMIIFATDEPSHTAGDGKLNSESKSLVGNDGLCHLDNYGKFTHDLVLDYPSIGQIGLKAQQNKMSIIFAVTESGSAKYFYENVLKSIPGSLTGELKKDSINVVQLIEDAYDKLTQKVTFVHNSSSPVSLRFQSNCLSSGALTETYQCTNIRNRGDKVYFNVSLEVAHECPENRSERRQMFDVYPQSVPFQKLMVDLEIECELCSNCQYTCDQPFVELDGPMEKYWHVLWITGLLLFLLVIANHALRESGKRSKSNAKMDAANLESKAALFRA